MDQKKSQLKIGILLNYVNMGLGNLIPIFYTPIMLSILGQSEYGLYKLSSSVTSYLSLISMGLGSAIVRYLIKAREEQGKEAEESILGLFMVIFHGIAAVTVIVGFLLAWNLDIWYGESLSAEELSRMCILVVLMACNMAVSFTSTPYLSVVNAHEKFLFLQSMNIMLTCVGPLLNLVVLFMGYASVGMVVSSLAISILVRILYLGYVRRRMSLQPRYKKMPRHLLIEIFQFSFWVFVANVVGQLYAVTDTVMMGAVPTLATVGVAVYTVGNLFNSVVFSLTTGVSGLLAPKINKMVFSGVSMDELTELSIKVGRIQCYIITLLVTGFIAFGRPFIQFYVGDGYHDAYWVAILMMVPNMIPLVQSVCLNVIVAQNKHKFRSLVYLGIAVANVIGTWFLMQVLGVIGAALMTGVALIVGQGIIMNWYYHKKTGMNMVRFWREVGKIYWIPVGMCMITLIISRWINFYSIWNMMLGIVLYTLLYCVLNWRYVMNTYEKELGLSMVEKLRTTRLKVKR